MAEFRITCVKQDGGRRVLLYDNQTNELIWEETREPVTAPVERTFGDIKAVSASSPGEKRNVTTLKISLGLSCNYGCGYCSQRFVPHASEAGLVDIEPFLDGLPEWFNVAGSNGRGEGLRIEFWGGEPLVYWKTLRPLAEALRDMMPDAAFGIVTNGSLLDPEKNEWLDRLGFAVGISHDGPAQSVRGPDPLDDPAKADAIRDLFRRLSASGRVSFNVMMHRKNQSRAAVQDWFVSRFGSQVRLAEGGVIDPYDRGGAALSLMPHEHTLYRSKAFHDLRMSAATNFAIVGQKVEGFMQTLAARRPASSLGQKCGMDRPDHMAVTLKGEVITCQNVSPVSRAPNGKDHHVGDVSDLPGVRLDTSTHWSHRAECPKCPVLALCGGSCMFLEGRLFEIGCDNAYSDNIPFFAAAIEILTGMIPVHIDGPNREDRKWIWGKPG